ncbi:hypothetical protein NHQ30_003482 [Ciborinia camelliae]|nr:hypothetical protein NHQ30_003482 [Ciborinia camelliae]
MRVVILTNEYSNQFATTNFGGGLEFLKTVYSIWNSSISEISSVNGTNWAMVIQPFPTAFMTSRSEENALGLSTSSGPQTLFLLSYSWASADDDEKVTAAAQKLIDDIDAAARKVGVAAANNFKYLNYAAYWQNPIAGYGQKSVQNLKEVSKKYDPNGIFQEKCPGGFKISKC